MSIKKIKTLLLISLLFYSCNIQKKKSLTKILNQYTNNLGHFGFQGNILVANEDKVTINKFIGYHNSEPKTQLYPIASITKSFTAVSILLLKQQGKLQLSDTINNYFNDVPIDKSSITIRQLLTHTSGLQRDVRNLTNENFTEEIFKSPLKYKIGEKFSYSNAGYMLLGKIIEIVSGISFKDFIKEYIFKPSKMNHSFFEKDTIHWKNIPETQNEYGNFKVFNKNYTPFGIGNTGIVSNAEDLNKWFRALLKEKVLNKQNLNELFTPHIKIDHPIQDSYGYGFYFKTNSLGDTLISHGGDIFGYHSEFTYNKKNNNTTIVLTNTERYNVGIHKRSITEDIHKMIENQPVEISKISINDNINTIEFLGKYRLDSINEIEIYTKQNRLMLGVKGQKAINLFKVKTEEQFKYVSNKNSLTNKIINAINKRDTLALNNICILVIIHFLLTIGLMSLLIMKKITAHSRNFLFWAQLLILGKRSLLKHLLI